MKHRIILLIGIPVILLTSLYVRTILSARKALQAALFQEEERNFDAAVKLYSRAISWDSPGNPYSQQAAQQLWKIARSREQKEKDQKPQKSLEAYRLLREGIFSSRNFLRPLTHSALNDLLIKTDEKIDQLSGANVLRQMIREKNPPRISYRYQILSQIFFWGWICSTVFLIFRAFTPQGKIIRSGLAYGLCLVSVFFALWLYCLSLA